LHKIDGFLKRSFGYGFTSKLLTIEPILDSAVEDLFCKMQLTSGPDLLCSTVFHF